MENKIFKTGLILITGFTLGAAFAPTTIAHAEKGEQKNSEINSDDNAKFKELTDALPENTSSVLVQSYDGISTRRASKRVSISINVPLSSRISNYYYVENGYRGLLFYNTKWKGASGKTWWVEYSGTIYK